MYHLRLLSEKTGERKILARTYATMAEANTAAARVSNDKFWESERYVDLCITIRDFSVKVAGGYLRVVADQ